MKRNYTYIPRFISSNLMRLIAVAVILSLILVASVGWNTLRMYGNFTKVVTTEFQLQSLAGKIVHFDEVLTMSARMSAATGDLKWEERYRQFEPELDRAIEQAIDLAPETYANQPAETDAANFKLVKMENESFDLVRQGQPEKALELLFSPEYERQKQIYATGIDRTLSDLSIRVESNVEYYRQSLFWSSLFTLLSFPILSLAWVTILRLVNWYVIQRKQAERTLKIAKIQLEEINKTLEDKVKERTIQLQYINKTLEDKVKERTAQLREAKEKAETANQAKDRFLANISHELRTPLNSILGYTNLMIRDLSHSKLAELSRANPNKVKNLNIIKNSGSYLLTLINDILDYSKVKADKMELQPTNLNLPTFLSEIIDIVESWANEKGLAISWEHDRNLPTDIQADEKRLRQVLINLLSNAIKFTQQGQITLKVNAVSTRNLTSPQKISFEVIDTGIGIDRDKITTIFNPFEQIEDRELKSSGTGLGLSISYQLVELMGGKLEVESELGKGSRFWFEAIFPAIQITFSQAESKSLNPSKMIVGYQGRKRKILVVDDRAENRSLLKDLLEPIGFKVVTAENGQEMLNIVKIEQPDLVLLDLFMPVKTGFTSAKELRKISGLEDIPLVIVSASSMTEQTIKYLNCDAYLSKPIEERRLFSLLKKYLNLKWNYQQVSSSLLIK